MTLAQQVPDQHGPPLRRAHQHRFRPAGAIGRRSQLPPGDGLIRTTSESAGPTRLARAALVASLACILGATLAPVGTEFQPDFVSCILCGSRDWADAVSNLLLYAPLGAALAWNGRVGWRPVFYAFLLSACIELSQTVIPGRDPSLGDVTFNTLGAAAGQLGAVLARRWLVPDVPAAARCSLAAAALGAAVFALTGMLLAPEFPTTTLGVWYTPALPEMSWDHARVLSARIGAIRLHTGPLSNAGDVRRSLMTGAPLDLEAIAGPPVPTLGPLVVFEDDGANQIYLVGPDRADLVLRYQTRAARWGLDQPDIRLRDAFATVKSSDTIRIDIRRQGAGYCLSLNSLERCGLGYTIGAAWAMVLYPRHWPPWAHALLGAMWVGGLALPVGLWSRRRVETVLAVALFGGAAALVPPLVALSATPAREWWGAALGWGAGVALQVVLRRRSYVSATGS